MVPTQLTGDSGSHEPGDFSYDWPRAKKETGCREYRVWYVVCISHGQIGNLASQYELLIKAIEANVSASINRPMHCKLLIL